MFSCALGHVGVLVTGLGLSLVTTALPARADVPVDQVHEWTQNSDFDTSEGGWWARAFRWDSATGQTWDGVENEADNYGVWATDGLVQLGAYDSSWWNTVNNAAWVTQDGPPLPVAPLSALTLTARVSHSGTGSSYVGGWTGIKFDLWFRDTLRGGRPLYIETYFLRTGLNHMWCFDFLKFEQQCYHETARYLNNHSDGGTFDDYLVNLGGFLGHSCFLFQCLPDFVDMTKNPDGSTTYVVDVKAFAARGARYFGRDLAGYELVTVGTTLESGVILLGKAGKVWTDVHELAVTYQT